MSKPALKPITVDEFLAWEAQQEDDNTYELCDGQIVVKDGEAMLVGGVPMVMSAPSAEHQEIATNIVVALSRRLLSPCRPIGQAKVPHPERATGYYRPDVVVTCTPGPAGQAMPRLIVEVLSPTTKDYDRGSKLDDYQAMPSVDLVLLVHSDVRRARLWQRAGEAWLVRDFIGHSAVPLEPLDVELPLDEVYAGVIAA